ncbi:MAG: hypothetical protein MJ248_04210 [Bacilli bacterium]|nr:hypothetical protein [Bacilli bacterium]
MKNNKYRCKVCGQFINPNPDGSCPKCEAPKSLVIIIRDKDDDSEPYKRR